MPAAMNLQPLKIDMIRGVVRHCFRDYEPEQIPPHIDPERARLNVILYGDQTALDNLPTHQPDTGRKIRKDANRAASMVCTLPNELDPDATDAIDAWVEATMEWLRKECPGTLAWAVLHKDESRPHIHAAVIPEDERGHLNWRDHFHGRQVLRDLQKTYTQALRPLGVKPHSELEKAARKAGYTKGIHGWRAGRAVLDAQERVREAEQQVAALNPKGRSVVIQRPRWYHDSKAYFKDLEKRWAGVQRQATAWRQECELLKKRLARRDKTNERLTRQVRELARMVFGRTPEMDRPDLARELREMGVQADPAERVLAKERLRQWQKDPGRDVGL